LSLLVDDNSTRKGSIGGGAQSEHTYVADDDKASSMSRERARSDPISIDSRRLDELADTAELIIANEISSIFGGSEQSLVSSRIMTESILPKQSSKNNVIESTQKLTPLITKSLSTQTDIDAAGSSAVNNADNHHQQRFRIVSAQRSSFGNNEMVSVLASPPIRNQPYPGRRSVSPIIDQQVVTYRPPKVCCIFKYSPMIDIHFFCSHFHRPNINGIIVMIN